MHLKHCWYWYLWIYWIRLITLMVQLSKLLMVMHHSCRMFGAQLEYM